MLTSAIQHHESATRSHTSPPSWTSLPPPNPSHRWVVTEHYAVTPVFQLETRVFSSFFQVSFNEQVLLLKLCKKCKTKSLNLACVIHNCDYYFYFKTEVCTSLSLIEAIIDPLHFRCPVAKLCPTLRDSMDCSTPGFPVPHHIPEFAQVHVHWIDDAIQPSHPLSPSSAFNLSQQQGLFSLLTLYTKVI